MIKAIIMAGGEGTRLRPLTCNRSKPMVPVINKPVIEHTINLLRRHKIRDIIISLFYLPENVQNYFGDGSEWDVDITYSVEETPLGAAGGVKKAAGNCTDTIVVLSGMVNIDIPGIKIAADVWIGKDTEIHPRAIIEGPAIIGNFVKIREGADIFMPDQAKRYPFPELQYDPLHAFLCILQLLTLENKTLGDTIDARDAIIKKYSAKIKKYLDSV
jgi:NDP-sugar pyrophosphorylase family protein